MALRLRKDVQKASYYVWFLGAEEARGLRGPRVLLPAIPHLIERSREQEPLKVTLQVSQKGMKIVQGASKHFITHSAITCSVQTDDIVACVLLLYNPTTKCPLHVHAYRCDSETTAQALHQFLQVLINRPENQKRFAELEARLGLQSMSVSSSSPRSPSSPNDVLQPVSPSSSSSSKLTMAADGGSKQPVRRFESSLGSDTGTSTRESECSEELVAGGPALPKSSLYDSLAAELRAKLNGNGPPLLLPPRDYDTVHRSKGNLAATELRRCRNSLIVGDKMKKQQQQQQSATALTTRSRGSSGIGSDLAPSPERPIEHSSSDDEEWIPSAHHHLAAVEPDVPPFLATHKTPQRTSSYSFKDQFDGADNGSADRTPQAPPYLYPMAREEPEPIVRSTSYSASPSDVPDKRRLARSGSREKSGMNVTASGRSTNHTQGNSHATDEQDIRPIIIRPRTYDSRFKHVLEAEADDHDQFAAPVAKVAQPVERKYRTVEDVQMHKSYASRYTADGDDDLGDSQHRHHQQQQQQQPPAMQNYRYGEKKKTAEERKADRDHFDYRENLTDREKYRESQKYNQMYKSDQLDDSQHHHSPKHHAVDYPSHEPTGMRVRKSYAEPTSLMATEKSARHGSPGAAGHKSSSASKYALHELDPEPMGGYHHQRHAAGAAAEPVKLSRSFKDKTASVEYDQGGGRNPYKEPDSLPYRESIEKMLKSPVMRYKSFEAGAVVAPGNPRDSAIRYHNLDEAAIEPAMQLPQQSHRRRGPAMEHQLLQMRSGSPDTVCRVSPKDRFNNAKEKFEAMERERNYTAHENRAAHLHTAQPLSMRMPHEELLHGMGHQRSQSPQQQQPVMSHRSGGGGHQFHQQHQQPAYPQQRYSMHSAELEAHGRGDWSSEDEPSQHLQQQQQQHLHQQHHSQHMSSHQQLPPHSSRGGTGYRDGAGVPAPDPYSGGSHDGARDAGRGGHGGAPLGAAKSLGNLVRGYRHSYAEPPARHPAPLPRNSGRVGLAAVNPF